MELLCLKTDTKYLRILNDQPVLETVQKASVYPLSQKENVKKMHSEFIIFFPDLKIKKLKITEEDFE